MNYAKLEKNLIDNIHEAQIKLGYDGRPISLNYMLTSLNHLIESNASAEEMEKILLNFPENRLGKITFRKIKNGFCITVPSEGTKYVHENNSKNDFITEFINTISKHGITFEDVLGIFRKYSDKITVEEKHNEEFDYLVYFSDGIPDEYYYCITVEDCIDGGCHLTYHRFIKRDYEEFGF